jgi:hypothetical protein
MILEWRWGLSENRLLNWVVHHHPWYQKVPFGVRKTTCSDKLIWMMWILDDIYDMHELIWMILRALISSNMFFIGEMARTWCHHFFGCLTTAAHVTISHPKKQVGLATAQNIASNGFILSRWSRVSGTYLWYVHSSIVQWVIWPVLVPSNDPMGSGASQRRPGTGWGWLLSLRSDRQGFRPVNWKVWVEQEKIWQNTFKHDRPWTYEKWRIVLYPRNQQ